MLELLEKKIFEAAIITVLHYVKVNNLEMNGKIELSKETKNYFKKKESQMEILELRCTISEIKNSPNALNSRMQMTEESVD